MATFYIQLENKLLQISGDLTADNISKALGYVPVSHNVTNELSQRIDNITFDGLKDNPLLQDGSGELNVVDEAGNIIAKIDAEGIHSVDFIAGEHRLSDKTDKIYVDEAVKNVKVDLTGYATEEYVNNIDFYNIKDNPIVNNGDGKLLFVDENGYIGLQLEEDGLYVKDVIADGHTLSQKADKSELSNYATKDEVSDLVDMSVVTELQGKVNTLVGEDADKSVRDIAVDVLTETLVSETATEAYDTLAEMSAWIKSHPEDASAMNTAIQKNATDITNLDVAYKAADAKVLTDAQEYTDNINFFTIKDNPIVDNNDGNLTFVDESGNIGLQFSNNAILVNDVITPEHTLSSKADKSELPTKTSDLTNDSGFITINDIPVLEEYVTETELNDKGFLTEHQDISHLASKEWVNSNNYATEEDLSSIEFNSLQNNPIVEDSNGEFNLVDDLGNVGFKVNQEGLFVKDVIAGEHMLSNKADKTYIDDLGVTELNAILVDTDAEADDPIIPDYITENELEVALKDKQDKLVSGENIKTINGESILGSGDITISGGSSNSNVQAVDTGDVIDDVTVDYATKTYVDGLVGDINNVLESIING